MSSLATHAILIDFPNVKKSNPGNAMYYVYMFNQIEINMK